MRFLVQLSSLLFVQCALSANILFLLYHDSGSHQGSASRYFIRLAEAAHRVTIFDTTSKTPRIHHPNVTAIDAYMPPAEDPKAKADFLWNHTLQGWQIAFGFWRGDADLGRMLEQRSAELTEALSGHWDLVMVDEIFTSHGYAAAVWRGRVMERSKHVVFGTSWRMHNVDSVFSLTDGSPQPLLGIVDEQITVHGYAVTLWAGGTLMQVICKWWSKDAARRAEYSNSRHLTVYVSPFSRDHRLILAHFGTPFPSTLLDKACFTCASW